MDRNKLRRCALCLMVLAEELRSLILVPPPLYITAGQVEIYQRIVPMLNALHQFISLAPPVVSEMTLKNRLFFDFHAFYGRYVFTIISHKDIYFG